MAVWTAKKFKLPNMNFEATAIRFEDGRVGLCYHGRTIWQEADGGWDESVSQEWQSIWKNGRLCPFHELPEDMRLICPKCGHNVGADDDECLHCGVILSKALPVDRLEGDSVDEPAAVDKIVKRRSRMVDAVLVLLALVIVGGIFYNLTRPKAVEQPPGVASVPIVRTTPVEQSRPEYDYSRQEQVFQEEKVLPAEMPARTEPVSVEQPEEAIAPAGELTGSGFYRHIDLNDRAGAHEALQVEVKKLGQERQQIEAAQNRPMTMDENQALREKMVQYNAKNVALQDLINAYRSRYGNP